MRVYCILKGMDDGINFHLCFISFVAVEGLHV